MTSKPSAAAADDAGRAYAAILRLLTRRDYSVCELRRRLSKLFPEPALEQALARSRAHNYQSDERCVQQQLRHCEFALCGPIRLYADLQRRGVKADQTLHPEHATWSELACQALCRRYHIQPGEPTGEWDRSRRLQALSYLMRRGFTPQQCLSALRHVSGS